MKKRATLLYPLLTTLLITACGGGGGSGGSEKPTEPTRAAGMYMSAMSNPVNLTVKRVAGGNRAALEYLRQITTTIEAHYTEALAAARDFDRVTNLTEARKAYGAALRYHPGEGGDPLVRVAPSHRIRLLRGARLSGHTVFLHGGLGSGSLLGHDALEHADDLVGDLR